MVVRILTAEYSLEEEKTMSVCVLNKQWYKRFLRVGRVGTLLYREGVCLCVLNKQRYE